MPDPSALGNLLTLSNLDVLHFALYAFGVAASFSRVQRTPIRPCGTVRLSLHSHTENLYFSSRRNHRRI